MEHVQHEPRRDPSRRPPLAERAVAPDAAVVPSSPGRWERVPIAAPPRAPAGVRRRPEPIVATLSYGARTRSWAVDPGLVAILALAAAAVGLCLLDALLSAFLIWAL